MNLDLYTRFTESYTSLCRRLEDADERVLSYERQLDEVLSESSLLERCRDAMGSAKELLTKSSLTQCERLATLAVRSIFGLDAKVVYDSDASKFLLDYGDGKKERFDDRAKWWFNGRCELCVHALLDHEAQVAPCFIYGRGLGSGFGGSLSSVYRLCSDHLP